MLSSAMHGNFRRSAPLLAATLLVVLVAHLLFMSSSLHEQRLTEASSGDATASLAAHSDTPQLAYHDAHQLAGHCLIQWVKSSQGTVQVGSLAVGPAIVPGLAGYAVPGVPPAAQAIGPPSTTDRQALLQVFRL